MGKNKLAKFADMRSYPHVFEHPATITRPEPFPMKGHWREEFFGNENPIILELGCGRGEYTTGLARRSPYINFIGVDIKGARMWTGATEALQEGLKNVAFLRTNIEMIDLFFGPGEVDGIWLTFPDPQMKKVTKRLTSTSFLERYRHFLKCDAPIHLKTDSPFMFTYTSLMAQKNHLPVECATSDLYALPDGEEPEARAIRTYYEQQWIGRGFTIKYLRFLLPASVALDEPDVEIELDDYRSYNRNKRSSLETSK